ncbi:putative hydrolase or acyltransferase (alpha/beta hydrolase superfamily) [Rubidibacter lacunae KORDI 51-2]|uniref:Putative hydrolase or acyltransferase (Alpha/beta hydrolase superfamily) n=1 Tax=Rubidibacter lacunae KORDI 51-2 TaxID=582515 RepID=U5DIK2_9CHRO|nr:alpha/beta hydrolase [Rubidibacter lacunae]ERN41496.1 putative hydrolase or acyltransferase (alpha/beta hydrolase superfamily) [Rubidibacter lacunae KORDI 51-2]
MATIEIAGVPHAYTLTPARHPNAPVLVFVHGWLLSRSYWEPAIARLSPDYQCLSYDLRGFGDSAVGAGSGYALVDYARDLKQLLQQLAIDRAWLIGHSLGGSIALWGAKTCPERVAGVICVNAGGGIYLEEEFDRFRSTGEQLVRRRPRWLPYVPFLDRVFARAMVARPLARRWGRQRLLDFVKADTQAALGALLDSTTENEVHLLPQLVSQLEQPAYFLAGERDAIMELQYVRHLASFHSSFGCCGDNTISIPNCGHLAMVEQPDTVVAIVRRLLDCHQAERDGR